MLSPAPAHRDRSPQSQSSGLRQNPIHKAQFRPSPHFLQRDTQQVQQPGPHEGADLATGSVVRSWLLDLLSIALKKNAEMAGIAPYVSDSGEGRWTVTEAIDLDVPAPVITLSLLQRLTSRDTDPIG